METALIGGLLGILGGIISGLVVSILSQRKNEAEIKRLEAETRKINTELDNTQVKERKEIFSKIHDLMHTTLGIAESFGNPKKYWPELTSQSDEYITDLLEEGEISKFEIKEILRAENKTKLYKDRMIWREYLKLRDAKNDFHNYVIEKEIVLDDEDFLKYCSEFEIVIDYFLVNINDHLGLSDVDIYLVEIYRLFKTDFDMSEEKIDSYIKSQLRPKIKA